MAYTSDIVQRLKEAELPVVKGTLYPLLTRLRNGHLLSYGWQESTQGPLRECYVLTEEGAVFPRELGKVWGEIAAAVNYLK